MIVDKALTFDLTIGVDKRIPVDGDAQVQVPALVMPVCLMIQPTRVSSAAGVETTSHLAESLLTRAASLPSTSTTVTTLAAGLWELELSLASWFDFQNTVGLFLRNVIELSYQGFTITLVARLVAPGSFTDYQRLRLLLSSNAGIIHRVPATGVAQTLDSEMMVNAIRIL